MSPPLRLLIRASLLMAVGLAGVLPLAAHGQDQVRYFAPPKDVAMLVDVSVSVKGDRKGHEQAKRIIQDVLTGKPFSNSNWNVQADDPALQQLFANYLGLPPAPESAELRPLMAPGNTFLSLPVGELLTVLNGEVHRKLGAVQGIESMVDDGYPRQMNDTSTCYWFAMAQAADTLSQHSRLGYYLFVVSDEEDDPDYRADGPPGHTVRDYKEYKQNLAERYPEEALRKVIGKYFTPASKTQRGAETYVGKPDFKQELIARFVQRGDPLRPGSDKVRVSWYAMGVEREKMFVRVEPPPPPPPPGQPAPLPPPAYQAPKLTPRIQLLGGLEAGKKVFSYDKPILVWQVENLENSSANASRAEVRATGKVGKVGKFLDGSRRKIIKSWELPETLDNGTYTLNLQISDLEDGGSQQFTVIKSAGSARWLTILAIASAVAAVGIFIFAWRRLRQPKSISVV